MGNAVRGYEGESVGTGCFRDNESYVVPITIMYKECRLAQY